MTPEQQARKNIDRQLEAAGWKIQDYKDINLGAGLGIAVREVPVTTGSADYMLFVDRKAVGVIEAKKEGTVLNPVEEQTKKYLLGISDNIPHVTEPLPFGYESTGVETFYRDLRDPQSTRILTTQIDSPCAPGRERRSRRSRPTLTSDSLSPIAGSGLEFYCLAVHFSSACTGLIAVP